MASGRVEVMVSGYWASGYWASGEWGSGEWVLGVQNVQLVVKKYNFGHIFF